jgi:hypothetical protein
MIGPKAAFQMLFEEKLLMQKLLVIATLSLGTFASAQTMASNMGEAQQADHDFYNQTVTAQAKQNSLVLSASALSASSFADSESQSSQKQPSSMASNAGSQSTGDDFYQQDHRSAGE